ncbi:MAG: GIY-YIG nuclease family protein [Deltaproteobacteria bacterium]|nr:GIY-YIG nuclease family protein [Deltaproteobacteria bacterium]
MLARHWTVYILRCGDGSLYTGITDRLQKRLEAHRAGRRGARYTRSRLPIELVWSSGRKSGTEARKLEHAIKRLTRREKLRLVAGSRRLWSRLRRAVLGAV